jgi:hypothetical protein
MTTRTRQQSTIRDQLLDISNLVQTLSRTLAPNMPSARSQEHSTPHEDPPQGQAHNDNTRTHNIRHIILYLPATKLIMMRRSEPVSPPSFLPPQQSGAFPSLANPGLHRPQHPVASTRHPSAWCLSQ